MRLGAPEWLLLLPLLVVAGWAWPHWRLWRAWRVVCLLLVVLLLVRPQLRLAGDGLDLWVLVDQSDSAQDVLHPLLPEWEMILERSRGPDDRLRFVDFAGDAVERGATLIVMDPRGHALMRHATHALRFRAGTDVALLNAKAVGRHGTSWTIINLASTQPAQLQAFEQAVRDQPEILDCYYVAGADDYLVRFAYRDAEDLERLHAEVLPRLPGVVRSNSMLVLRTVKKTTALAL